jgi:tRNA G37 N-methylase TrmD
VPEGGAPMQKSVDSILNSELTSEQKLIAQVLTDGENLNMNDVRVQKALMKTTEFRENLLKILKEEQEAKEKK